METAREEQEVTVEVVPQTVADIVYLNESEPNYYIPSEDEEEDNEDSYEIGSVDSAYLKHKHLILDESRSFVLLPHQDGCFDDETTLGEDSNDSFSGSDSEWHPPTIKYNNSNVQRNQMKHHTTVIHPTHFRCNKCPRYFIKAKNLSHHLQVCHQPKDPESPKLKCSICGCPCVHDGALLAHYKKHEPKQFSCDACNSSYDNAVDLNNHKKTHSTDLLYACNKCNAEFSSTAALSVHLRMMHARPRALQIVSRVEKCKHVCSINTNDSKLKSKPKKCVAKVRSALIEKKKLTKG